MLNKNKLILYYVMFLIMNIALFIVLKYISHENIMSAFKAGMSQEQMLNSNAITIPILITIIQLPLIGIITFVTVVLYFYFGKNKDVIA